MKAKYDWQASASDSRMGPKNEWPIACKNDHSDLKLRFRIGEEKVRQQSHFIAGQTPNTIKTSSHKKDQFVMQNQINP